MNFEKDLREYTDDELYKNLNQHNPSFGSLSSDELTRRSMEKLNNSINKLNNSTDYYSDRLLGLTLLLFAVAIFQLLIPLGLISDSLIQKILLSIFILAVISWMVWSVKKEIDKRDKERKETI